MEKLSPLALALNVKVVCETSRILEYPPRKSHYHRKLRQRQSQVTNLGALFLKISKILFRIFLSQGTLFLSTCVKVAVVTVAPENDIVPRKILVFISNIQESLSWCLDTFILAYPAKKQTCSFPLHNGRAELSDNFLQCPLFRLQGVGFVWGCLWSGGGHIIASL